MVRRITGSPPAHPASPVGLRAFGLRHDRALATTYASSVSRIFSQTVGSVYPLYLAKLEKKGRTQRELDEVIMWLTGFDEASLQHHLSEGTTFSEFFSEAALNEGASRITGVVCGVRVENVEDPLMQKIRYLDKLVDELSKGKPMEKVLRTMPASS